MRKILKLASLVITPIALAIVFSPTNAKAIESKAYTAVTSSKLPTTIYLGDNTDSEIRDYYSGLNLLDESERKGQNLLKNLKPILMDGQKYFSYDSGSVVWQYYEITDRDWTLSPASSTTYGHYDPDTNTITGYVYGDGYTNTKNNPYLHLLYRNLGEADGYIKAWGTHGSTKTDPNGIDREHVWPKSHGFDEVVTGARGDPHHLIAGDHIINNNHSDITYGNVLTHDSSTLINSLSYLDGNYKGTSKRFNTGKVFEPQDSDKGDIARACFYMVARYNNIAGNDPSIDSANPNLTLADEIVTRSGASTASDAYSLGILSDLLEWHKLDPVDEYERHRNNLIFNNYGMNRNPFIDFPEWVDAVWGNGKAVNPASDTIFVPTHDQTYYEPISGSADVPEFTYDDDSSTQLFSLYGFVNATPIYDIQIDEYTTLSFDKNGGDTPKYYVEGEAIRLYAKNKFTFKSDKEIRKIEFIFDPAKYNRAIVYAPDEIHLLEGNEFIPEAPTNEAIFTLNSETGYFLRIQAVKIYYESERTADVFDIINTEVTTGQGTYSDVEFVTNSGNKFKGSIMESKEDKDSVFRVRSTYSKGIVQTNSVGYIRTISIDVNKETRNGITFTFYGSKEPFTDVKITSTERKQYDKIAEFVYNSESPTSEEIEVNGDYLFIALFVSNGTTGYINEISLGYDSSPSKNARGFANYFLDLTRPICEDNGTEDNKNDLSAIWKSFVNGYGMLNEEEKDFFENVLASEEVLDARERLDVIISRYNLTNFTSLEMTPSKNINLNVLELFTDKDNNSLFLIILILIGAFSIVGYLSYRKRKYN